MPCYGGSRDPADLKKSLRDSLTDRRNAVFISAVTTWEISIKAVIGKLTLPEEPKSHLAPSGPDLPCYACSPNTYEVFSLPLHHLDPFDRLLIAQARMNDLSIVTADRALA